MKGPTKWKGSDSLKSITRQSMEALKRYKLTAKVNRCIPSHVLRVPSKNDISASSRHVSGNGDCLAAATLGHNLRFPLHILRFGIQQLHHNPTSELPSKPLLGFARQPASQKCQHRQSKTEASTETLKKGNKNDHGTWHLMSASLSIPASISELSTPIQQQQDQRKDNLEQGGKNQLRTWHLVSASLSMPASISEPSTPVEQQYDQHNGNPKQGNKDYLCTWHMISGHLMSASLSMSASISDLSTPIEQQQQGQYKGNPKQGHKDYHHTWRLTSASLSMPSTSQNIQHR